MFPQLRHKRSKANVSPPVPASASAMMFEQNTSRPSLSTIASRPSLSTTRSRFSGEHLTPTDGYSTLFTSGLNPTLVPSPATTPTLSSFPSPPRDAPPAQPSQPSQPFPASEPAHPHPQAAYSSPREPSASAGGMSSHNQSPTRRQLLTPARQRRRSSIIASTPSLSPQKHKAVGLDNGVERALDNVMRSLKLVAMGTPRGRYDYDYASPVMAESRWSTSTTSTTRQQQAEDEDEGELFKPRKSSETSRSARSRAPSRATVRSTKSKKGRKSEDTDRMELDLPIDVPDVPRVPPAAGRLLPETPGRSRRLVQGLVRRLRFTPKKSRGTPPAMPTLEYPLPPPLPTTLASPLPLPRPNDDRSLPRKGSLSTIRSVLTKKGSSTTLRSTRASIPPHPFALANNGSRQSEHPPLPLPVGLPKPPARDWDNEIAFEGCLPSTSTPHTPKREGGRRTPKSSIGQPKLHHETSPSYFLDRMPRRAPETPKRTSFDQDQIMESTTPAPVSKAIYGSTAAAAAAEEGVIKFEIEDPSEDSMGDLTMASGQESMDQTHIFTPQSNPNPASQVATPQVLSLDSPFAPISQSTPTPILGGGGGPILTAKAAKAQGKPRRLLSLLPKHQGSPLSPSLLKSQPPALPLPLPHRSIGNVLPRPATSMDHRSPRPSLEMGNKGKGNVNALGLPLAKGPPTSGGGSLRDPLGIMRRFDLPRPATSASFRPADKENEYDVHMPFRSGAGDGWGTPLPNPHSSSVEGIRALTATKSKSRGVGVRGGVGTGRISLGTTESYFDYHPSSTVPATSTASVTGGTGGGGTGEVDMDIDRDTFGRTTPRPESEDRQSDQSSKSSTGAHSRIDSSGSNVRARTRAMVPDFTAPAPRRSRPISTSSLSNDVEPKPQAEAEAQRGGEVVGSPEYSFRLESASINQGGLTAVADENEISISSSTSVHGLEWEDSRQYQCNGGWGADPQSGLRRDSYSFSNDSRSESGFSVSMTTGEGVEEWELERYLRDLEGDERGRGEVVS